MFFGALAPLRRLDKDGVYAFGRKPKARHPLRRAPAAGRAPRGLPPRRAACHRCVLMAEGSPPQVDPSLKLILQAVSARGKSDLATIRTIAGLAGAGDALRALEKSFGISEDAAEADLSEVVICNFA